eukprot:COSAG02_NODE_1214_length_13857_cov_17.738334_5_plen_171_part_00
MAHSLLFGWNDGSALIIGNFGLSYTQSKAQMGLWSIMAAPLLMGNDLRNLDPKMKQILTAKEVIAVDQDVLGKQGYRVYQSKDFCSGHDVWMKPLSGGDIAVALWNRGVCGTHSLLTLNWTMISLPPTQPMAVRDLFEEKELGVHRAQYTGWVDIDDVLMLRLSKPSSEA